MKQKMTEQMFAKAVLRIIMDNSTNVTTIDEAFERFSYMVTYGELIMAKQAEKETDPFAKESYETLEKQYMEMGMDCWDVVHALRK